MSAEEQEQETYTVGDRVVLHGLQKAAHLNGRHGHVGKAMVEETGRYAVYLDLLEYPTAAVKPGNLKREGGLIMMEQQEKERAPCGNAILEEQYGRALCLILDTIRFIAATVLQKETENIRSQDDLARMRFSGLQRDVTKLNHYLATAWTCWLEPGSYSSPDGMGVFEMTKDWATVQMKENLKNAQLPVEERKFFDMIATAFEDKRCAKSWHVRVHGDFFIVGKDDQGTLLVPRKNLDTVYRCVGMTTALYDAMAQKCGGQGACVCVTLTMVPFFGRLVYDGVINFVGVASPDKAERLGATVERAKQEGRVIDRLMQLEVEGGSLEGYQTKLDTTPTESQPPASRAEKKLLKQLKKFKPLANGHPLEKWCFRRDGYTEQENPHHMGFIIADGDLVSPFRCAKLEPTAEEIMGAVIMMAPQIAGRPTTIMIDDFKCYERVKYLLAPELEGTSVIYYHPPTPEETAAVRIMPPGGF